MRRLKPISLNRNWAITGFSLLLLGLFLYLQHELMERPAGSPPGLDRSVLAQVQAHRTFGLTRYFLEITALGSASVLTTVTLLLLALLAGARLWRNFLQLLLVGLATPLLSSTLKNFAGRERPALEVRLDYVSSFSFPSGHSLAASAIYLTLAFMLLPLLKTRRRQVIFLFLTALFVAIIGLSRIYLGVHFLSDVAGGFCVGTGFACLMHIGFDRFWKSSAALKKLDHVS